MENEGAAFAHRSPAGRPVLVSASRRTDIPQFYGPWFAHRLQEGFASFRTAFGTPGRVSLRRENVLGFLFWTKFAGPFRSVLERLRADGVPFAFQYTLTGYGPALEGGIPPVERVLRDVLAVRSLLPGSGSLEWRYDPVVVCDALPVAWHRRNFTELCCALEGVVTAVNVSIVEPYRKTRRRMDPASPGVRYRGGAADEGAIGALLEDLACLSGERGIELRLCSNPERDLPPSRCASVELFRPWGAVADAIRGLPSRPSRPGCQCVSVVDIGMDNTCLGGCRYCYATVSDDVARRNFAAHDPSRPSLR